MPNYVNDEADVKIILPVEVAAQIEEKLPPEVQTVWVDDTGFSSDPSQAEVYFHWFTHKTTIEILAAAPKLCWQHTPSAGVDRQPLPMLIERDIILTNGAGVHAIPIAEFVLAFMLDHAKRLSILKAAQSDRVWKTNLEVQELHDATLLIIGAGGIGQEIAARASAFGMKVWGSRRHPQPLPNFERVVGEEEWRSLLREADYVVIAAPLTPQTRGMFDEAALRSLHAGAYLINIARGGIVNEAALLKALRENWFAGAALDTFGTEPLPPDSPFWTLPQVFVTPHFTGESPQVNQRSVALFLDNLERYQTGKSLLNVVDKKLGY